MTNMNATGTIDHATYPGYLICEIDEYTINTYEEMITVYHRHGHFTYVERIPFSSKSGKKLLRKIVRHIEEVRQTLMFYVRNPQP